MFAGKTTELQKRARRYKLTGKSVVMIKPEADNRYGEDFIITHDGTKMPAYATQNLWNILSEAQKFDVICIDEGHMFREIVDFSCDLADMGHIVVIASLCVGHNRRQLALLNPPAIYNLTTQADSITFLHAICVNCGKNASVTYKLRSEKEEKYNSAEEYQKSLIGGADKYKSLCRTCFYIAERKDDNLFR